MQIDLPGTRKFLEFSERQIALPGTRIFLGFSERQISIPGTLKFRGFSKRQVALPGTRIFCGFSERQIALPGTRIFLGFLKRKLPFPAQENLWGFWKATCPFRHKKFFGCLKRRRTVISAPKARHFFFAPEEMQLSRRGRTPWSCSTRNTMPARTGGTFGFVYYKKHIFRAESAWFLFGGD